MDDDGAADRARGDRLSVQAQGKTLRTASASSLLTPWIEASRIRSPSTMDTTLTSAAQSFSARLPMTSNTGLASVGERLITVRISLVAVWYSSDSCRAAVRFCTSSNSRTFSMAITAWSAKVVASAICLSLKGFTSSRVRIKTPMVVPSRNSGTPRIGAIGEGLLIAARLVVRIGEDVRNMADLAGECDAPGLAFPGRRQWMLPCVLYSFRREAVIRTEPVNVRRHAGRCSPCRRRKAWRRTELAYRARSANRTSSG